MINNNIRFGRIGGIFLFMILILSACATEPKREIIKNEPTIKVKAEPILPIDAIDKKISVLQDLLANNRVQEKDWETVSNLISDYQKIKDLSQGDLPQRDYREIILMLFRNLSLLDEKYLSSQDKVNNEIYAKALNDLYLKKQSIFKKYIRKDYKGVISECNELEKAFGKDSITFETGILLAMSLAKEGRLSEAINTGDRIIKEIEGMPDLIQLRAGLIEWRIDTGKKEKALNDYQKLIENLKERQTIFDKTTSRVNSQNKNIAEADQVLNNLLNKELNSDVNARITNVLKEVDTLINKGDFAGARLLLLKWKLRTNEPVEIAAIDKALKALDFSEKQYQENLKTNKKEGIEVATKLIEEEDYESAINMLDLIKNGGDSNPDISKQKNIAIEKLINKERNRAAKIFQAAKKTDDIKKKKELLLSAQNILKGLIEKYPSSGLIEKLNSHLDSVNNELKKIGKQ